ncbi:hypothetical protein LOC68_02615 [Blastopirellula sp. JC732]|uniref:CARDB domain-containing protein n=1 Tax=Blastopirellula sediminis TaxID=2894196 RepID=A0A9X1MIA1_9BACT|nr:hypothetical protein [Blastopirellula sediminis]MCC9607931.1 hypothetical protein [Blastopirellula sediminis]MCC9627276.1 hypothetical protein [Blastopirellula sediminis]
MSRLKYAFLALGLLAGSVASNCLADPLVPINAENIRTDQVLGIQSHGCGHVIHLLMKSRMLRESGQLGFGGPMFNPQLGAWQKPGDLQLLGVCLVADACDTAGPIYQIQLQNNSEIPVGNFRISAVGTCGQIQPFSPTAVITVPRIEAGAILDLQIQLPLSCLSIHNPGGAAIAFDTLIVAIDSFDELIECNETNNILILNRGEVAPLVVQEATVTEEATIETTTPPVTTTAPPVDGNVAAPSTPTSPMDSIDLDDLDLGEAEQTAVRLR